MKRNLWWPVALVVLSWGMASVPLTIMGPELSMIPGDTGDARFNNYILEHVHRWMSGKQESLWNIPMMYPYENVLALSDNHLGTAWIYSIFRHLGYERENAFLLWLLSMFVLNFLAASWAMRTWTKNAFVGNSAAFVFAFGIYAIAQINHVQVFAKAFLPIALACYWRWLSEGSPKWIWLSALAVLGQIYAALYLGMFLLIGLLLMTVSFFILNGKAISKRLIQERQLFKHLLPAIVVAVLLALPLLMPYMSVSDELIKKPYSHTLETVPRPSSYIFAHPVASSWHSLTYLFRDAYPRYWLQFNFPGAFVLLGIVLATVLFFVKRQKDMRLTFGTALLGLALYLLTTTNISEESFYHLYFQLPGFDALRSVDRIVHVGILLMLIPGVVVFDRIFSSGKHPWLAVLLLPVAIIDNAIMPNEIRKFSKYDEVRNRRNINERFQSQLVPADAYLFSRVLPETDPESNGMNEVDAHIDAMIAAQDLELPLVNAYTGHQPLNFDKLFHTMAREDLEAWLHANEKEGAKIHTINDPSWFLGKNYALTWETMGGLQVLCDEHNGSVHAKENHDEHTPYRVVKNENRVYIMAHSGDYFSIDVDTTAVVYGDVQEIGDLGIFELHPKSDGLIGLSAFNGKYLAVDSTGLISASADSLGAEGTLFRFQLERPTGSRD